MSNSPLFTILSATHNCLPFVGQMLRSVISQDYPNWEMFVIDDTSTDRTYHRALEITARHENMTVIQNKKRYYCGMTYAKLLRLARGKYCGVLDGDDTLDKDAISTVVGAYEAHPEIDFIWTQHRWWNERMDRAKPGLSHMAKKGTIYDSEGKNLKHIYSHWRTFKTEMRERGPLFRNLKCTVDKDLGYTLEELGQGAFLPKELYNYRYHKQNMSHHSSQKAVWRNVRVDHKRKKRPYKIIRL